MSFQPAFQYDNEWGWKGVGKKLEKGETGGLDNYPNMSCKGPRENCIKESLERHCWNPLIPSKWHVSSRAYIPMPIFYNLPQ